MSKCWMHTFHWRFHHLSVHLLASAHTATTPAYKCVIHYLSLFVNSDSLYVCFTHARDGWDLKQNYKWKNKEQQQHYHHHQNTSFRFVDCFVQFNRNDQSIILTNTFHSLVFTSCRDWFEVKLHTLFYCVSENSNINILPASSNVKWIVKYKKRPRHGWLLAGFICQNEHNCHTILHPFRSKCWS